MSSSLFGHRLECCLTQLQIATRFPISVHPAPCCRHSDASAPPGMQEQYLNTRRQHLSQHQLCDPQLIRHAAIRAAVMAVWASKPGCFLWPTADVTGGGFNGTADGALAGPLETGRFGAAPNCLQSGGKVPEIQMAFPR